MIAVMRGKGMKKVIVKATLAMKQKELKELADRLKKEWEEGLMIVPNSFKVTVVDEWIKCEKALPPEGKMVLIWYEYQEDEKVYANYGIGWIEGNQWLVCYAERVIQVIAWSSLPEPFSEELDD